MSHHWRQHWRAKDSTINAERSGGGDLVEEAVDPGDAVVLQNGDVEADHQRLVTGHQPQRTGKGSQAERRLLELGISPAQIDALNNDNPRRFLGG